METSGLQLQVGLGQGEHHVKVPDVATWGSWSLMTSTLEGQQWPFRWLLPPGNFREMDEELVQ